MKRLSKILLALAVVVLLGGFSFWYVMGCEGRWDGRPLEDSVSAEAAALEQALLDDVSFLSRTLGPRNALHKAALDEAAQWIEARWKTQGYRVDRHSFDWEGQEFVNLGIEIPGDRHPSEIVLLSAQYDTHPDSPGANNNASGMAVLLALSELLQGQRLDRTLRLVAFTNQSPPFSETPAMGSLRYAENAREAGEDIRVMLSMDAIGYYKQEPGTQNLPWPFALFYPDRGNFLAFIGDLRTRARVVEATRGFKKASYFPIEAAAVPRWVKGARWSDHGSFWDYGYPAIQVTDTGPFRSPYHRSSKDTLEKLDFRALARITLGMYGAMLELTTDEGLDPGAGLER
ncbi:MAG: M28 family peptidase [Gemmatimonadota bacterium]